MKLEPPKLRQARLQRQDMWRRERAATPTMRNAFPRVEQLRLELKFVEGGPRLPADQAHTMHPAAQAFFAFPCPYTDCDGRFDLSAAVTEALSKSAHRREGEIACTGHRLSDGASDRTCGLRLRYVLTARYHKSSAATERATA